MKIVAISDTHMSHEDVVIPNGDILVVAGDFSGHGTRDDVITFNAWLGTQPHRHKVVVAGNHDLFAEGNAAHMKLLLSNATYLDQESCVIDGVKFYGSPYTPQFGTWAFMYPRESDQARKIWRRIPADADVLITHGPPADRGLSLVKRDHNQVEDAGCYTLLKAIQNRPNLKVTIHGHLHNGHGEAKIGNTRVFNVSVMDDYYEVVNYATVIGV